MVAVMSGVPSLVPSLLELCVWKLARSIRYGPKRFRIARLSELPPKALDVLLGILIAGNALKDYVLEYMLTEETQKLGLQGACHLRRSVLIKVGASCPNLQRLDLRRCQHVTNQIVRNVLQHCTRLEMLLVDGCAKISDSAFMSTEPLPGLSGLRELSLGECSQITSSGLIEHIMSSAPDLKMLGLAFCEFVVTDAVASQLLYGCDLETLDISYCSQITDAPFQEGRSLHSLRKLSCIQVAITDSAVDALAIRAPLLEEFDAGYCLKLTDASVCAVALGCSRLRKVCVRNTDITDASFAVLARCCYLEDLDASWCSRATSKAITIMARPSVAADDACAPLKKLVLDHLGGCLAVPMAAPHSLTQLVSHYPSLQWLMLSNVKDVIDAIALRTIADKCSGLQHLAVSLPAFGDEVALGQGLRAIGTCCPQLRLLRLDASACHHHAMVDALAPPSFECLRSLSLVCSVRAGGLQDSELELLLSGRTGLEVLELRGCTGLSEGLFPSWCELEEGSHNHLNHALLLDLALATSGGIHVSQPSQKLPCDAKSIGSLSTEAPDTPCHELQGDWDTGQRPSRALCPAAAALNSVNKLLIEGAQDLSDRSADALAMVLHDAQEVDLRGSPQLTKATIAEHRSFRKWCRFLRSVNVVAGRRAFSWNASVRPVSRRHRRKLRKHHSQLSPIVEQLGQEGHSSSGAEEST